MRKIIILLLLFSYCTIMGQGPEFRQMIEASNDASLSEEDRLDQAEKALSYAKHSKSMDLIIESSLNLAQVQRLSSMYVVAIGTLQSALDSCDFANDSLSLGKIVNTQGVCFGELSHKRTAIRLFNTALKIFRDIKFKKGELQALNNIGLVYYYNNEYNQAKSYFLDLIKLMDESESEYSPGSTYLNLAHIYLVEHNYEKAEFYYSETINIADSSDINLLSLGLNGMAKLHLKFGDSNKAYEAITEIERLKNGSPKVQYVVSKRTKAEILVEMDSLESARSNFIFALNYSKKLGLKNEQIDILRKMSALYLKLDKETKAIELMNEAMVIMDSLSIKESVKSTKLQEEYFIYEQDKFNLEKEKKEAELSEHKAQLKINQQKLWMYILIGGFLILFVAVLAVILIHRNRVKYLERTNALKLEHEKEASSKLKTEIDLKIEQLTEIALILSQENEFLVDIKTELSKVKNTDVPEIKDIKIRLASVIKANSEKEGFYNSIENVNSQIIQKLKSDFPNITDSDVRLICLSSLKLSNKEISNLIGTSVKNVEMAKYRLKKKMSLNNEDSLEDVLKY